MIRNDTLESILHFLSDRLDSSEWEDVRSLKEIKIDITDADLKLCHRNVCPDFLHMDLILSYRYASFHIIIY